MARSSQLREIREDLARARALVDEEIDQSIPAAIVEAAPVGWLGELIAAGVRPPAGRPADVVVPLPDGRKRRGWIVRCAGILVVVLDRRSDEAIEAEYQRRAEDARR
ncbi:MAG TPA: hypothetical protein DCQ64_18275 [Candidatus Rokubacteria bacterium]|nr:hypothetical protein [Candidatus Rokubacteria bacterium]